ncbi:hypothetical protein Daura_39755 [Dactylosporangium aurantiacum]|uniref:Lipoprotein n=1 Tax=Dactylosporangium aurantiacum TaxID=35754 RepID=A0A9Q9MKC3_9ACTN|nr:hypothetical protein [Dactylosporangium aurantiacum]MDG6101440.1 hypothetical protein [Dactylosporangium aurantiacum]UWZ52707.1 hypothetical protein Daura_39755 [Dactylosporangium aurantiacum]
MRMLRAVPVTVMLGFVLAGCAAVGSAGPGGPAGGGGEVGGPAPLRGFGIDVDEAVAPRVPVVHLRVCGSWGCHEQDVPVHISGPVSAMPCPSGPAADPDTACAAVQLPGPGPGHGYAPVPQLTAEPVTVTVTTPPGAPLVIAAEVQVRPAMVCPGGRTGTAPATAAPATADCAGGAPQAGLRIAADGTVTQSR